MHLQEPRDFLVFAVCHAGEHAAELVKDDVPIHNVGGDRLGQRDTRKTGGLRPVQVLCHFVDAFVIDLHIAQPRTARRDAASGTVEGKPRVVGHSLAFGHLAEAAEHLARQPQGAVGGGGVERLLLLLLLLRHTLGGFLCAAMSLASHDCVARLGRVRVRLNLDAIFQFTGGGKGSLAAPRGAWAPRT